MTPVVLTLLAAVASVGSAERGAKAFSACTSCHNERPDALGPDIRKIIGRTAGTFPGYRYSGPLKRSGIVWSADNLRAFIANPQAVIPGNRMPFAGLSDPTAHDIAAYLAVTPK